MKTIIISGNLGSNAQRRTMSEGRELMTFSVAVNDNNSTTWFNCVSNFRERQFAYLTKGQQVIVSGDLKVGEYNGHPDLSINIDRLELAGGSKSDMYGVSNSKSEPDEIGQSFVG